MTPYLTPFVLIGGLVVLGLLVRVALVLLTAMRQRADAGAPRDEAAEGTEQDRAA
jgi:multidrug efflux pump subunit AcrB